MDTRCCSRGLIPEQYDLMHLERTVATKAGNRDGRGQHSVEPQSERGLSDRLALIAYNTLQAAGEATRHHGWHECRNRRCRTPRGSNLGRISDVLARDHPGAACPLGAVDNSDEEGVE